MVLKIFTIVFPRLFLDKIIWNYIKLFKIFIIKKEKQLLQITFL